MLILCLKVKCLKHLLRDETKDEKIRDTGIQGVQVNPEQSQKIELIDTLVLYSEPNYGVHL